MKKIIATVLFSSFMVAYAPPAEEFVPLDRNFNSRLKTSKPLEGDIFYDALENFNFEQRAAIDQGIQMQLEPDSFKSQKMELLGLPDSSSGSYDPFKALSASDMIALDQVKEAKQQKIRDQQMQRVADGLPTIAEVQQMDDRFEQAPLQDTITSEDLRALTDRVRVPGEAPKVLSEIYADATIVDKRDAVGAVASHVLKSAVDAVFGKDPKTPLELAQIAADLQALKESDVLTSGERAFMEQLLGELDVVVVRTISLQPDLVIKTLIQVENAFRSGFVSQQDAWTMVSEIKQNLKDLGVFTPEIENRIMNTMDVLNGSASSSRASQASIVPISSDIGTISDFISYMTNQINSYKNDPANAFEARKAQLTGLMDRAVEALPTPTPEEAKQLEDLKEELNSIYKQKKDAKAARG